MDWKSYFGKIFGSTTSESYKAASTAVDTITTILWIMVGVVGLAAVVYAIYLGFNLARASEQGKRDEAKKHLITVIIAIVVTLALIIFFLYLLPGILGAFYSTPAPGTEGGASGGNNFINMF